MAQITIHLPDDLVEVAQRIGVDVGEVCQRAVQSAAGRAREHERSRYPSDSRLRRRADDRQRFQRGLELGLGWARQARPDEIGDVAVWSGLRWRQFQVDPAANSLPAAYCRDNQLDEPLTGEPFWFERDAYTIGMVQGVAMAHSRSGGPAPLPG